MEEILKFYNSLNFRHTTCVEDFVDDNPHLKNIKIDSFYLVSNIPNMYYIWLQFKGIKVCISHEVIFICGIFYERNSILPLSVEVQTKQWVEENIPDKGLIGMTIEDLEILQFHLEVTGGNVYN